MSVELMYKTADSGVRLWDLRTDESCLYSLSQNSVKSYGNQKAAEFDVDILSARGKGVIAAEVHAIGELEVGGLCLAPVLYVSLGGLAA